MIVDDLTMVKCIGKGPIGEVYLTKKKDTNIKYATKRIDKKMTNSEKIKKYFLNGIEIIKGLNHDNIIKLIEIKEDKRYYYLVEEYCNGQSLRFCLDKYMEENDKPFPQEIIQYLMKQIVEAIKYLHNNNIIHRNLKLENILVKFDTEEDKNDLNLLKSNIKINGFLFSTRKANTAHQTVVGSPFNMDPIILKIFKAQGNPCPDLGYDEKADIWSLGSICYEMFLGKPMFNADSLEELISEAEKGKYILPYSSSNEIYYFMKGMLQYNSELRYQAEDLLKHPFLTKNVNNFEKINIIKIRGKIDAKGINMNFLNSNTTILSDFNKESYNDKSNNLNEKNNNNSYNNDNNYNGNTFNNNNNNYNENNNDSNNNDNFNNNNNNFNYNRNNNFNYNYNNNYNNNHNNNINNNYSKNVNNNQNNNFNNIYNNNFDNNHNNNINNSQNNNFNTDNNKINNNYNNNFNNNDNNNFNNNGNNNYGNNNYNNNGNNNMNNNYSDKNLNNNENNNLNNNYNNNNFNNSYYINNNNFNNSENNSFNNNNNYKYKYINDNNNSFNSIGNNNNNNIAYTQNNMNNQNNYFNNLINNNQSQNNINNYNIYAMNNNENNQQNLSMSFYNLGNMN